MARPRRPTVRVPMTIETMRKVSRKQTPSRDWDVMVRSKIPGPDATAEVWENWLYDVTARRYDNGWPFGGGPYVVLGICCHDGEARHDWRDFQRIKNDICGPEWEGIELYPAESRLLDPSNYYMIWCAPKIAIGKYEPRTILHTNCVAPQRPFHSNDAPEETEYGLKLVTSVTGQRFEKQPARVDEYTVAKK